MKPVKPKISPPLALPVLAELTPRGDGSYIMKPRTLDATLDSWITVKRASSILGLNRRSIYNLINPIKPMLVHRRLLSRKTMISVKSIHTFLQYTTHPDFWTDTLQRKKLQAWVKKEMEAKETDAPKTSSVKTN